MSLQDFKGMTREQFLGRPKIVTAQPPALAPINLRGAKPEAFLNGKYLATFSPRGALVYDADRIIASYWIGKYAVMFVNAAYRRQGIAFELKYQHVMRYGPSHPLSITAEMKALVAKVWDRIQAELAAA